MTEDRLNSLLASMDQELQSSVLALADALRQDPVVREGLAKAMLEVVGYLDGPGASDAHCRSVAIYFIVAKNAGLDRGHLPADLAAIMNDLAGAMHDAISSPQSASNFQATPAQLVARIQSLLTDAAS